MALAELPEQLTSVEAVEELLARPRPVLVEFIKTLRSPLVLLGAGGKMGPTLAELARRAALAAHHPLHIVAVSRFSNPAPRRWLEARGIETIACDMLEREQLRQLPDTENLIYMVGLKFGTRQNPRATWAVNTLAPAHVAERYPQTRMAVLSTGNVYSLVPADGSGAAEAQPLTPLGEYANTAVARERIFEYFADKHGFPLVLLRLNYAVELRYGVLLDIAQKVHAGHPVDVTMGCFNCLWQGDANELVLRALGLARHPPLALNLTGLEKISVRALAEQFGQMLGREPLITGRESETALLSNASRVGDLLGRPPTPLEAMVRWTADWVRRNGPTLNKPTGFQIRDGQF